MIHIRRALLGSAFALAAFAGSEARASSFDFNQYFAVNDDSGFGSQNVIYYYNSGITDITPYQQFDYFFYYSLPFDADIGLFHYSYLHGGYTEAVYLNDYAL